MSKEKVFSPKQLHKLESPQRYEALPPNEIWDIIGLHDGDCVGDVGCGIGFFSIPAAQRVGANGKVLATDISAEMLAGLKQRIPDAVRDRIECVQTDGIEIGLSDSTCDVVLIATVLHEVDRPGQLIEKSAQALKKGGRLAVIEWVKKDMKPGPSMDIRISSAELDTLAEKAGMTNVLYKMLSERFYVSIYKKQ